MSLESIIRSLLSNNMSKIRWHMPWISAFGRQRQEDLFKFESRKKKNNMSLQSRQRNLMNEWQTKQGEYNNLMLSRKVKLYLCLL